MQGHHYEPLNNDWAWRHALSASQLLLLALMSATFLTSLFDEWQLQ
jgi:hypothetical protein